jgi:hypothetical protein
MQDGIWKSTNSARAEQNVERRACSTLIFSVPQETEKVLCAAFAEFWMSIGNDGHVLGKFYG